jgi:hypothetical protein
MTGSVLAVHDDQFQLDGDEDPAISQNTPGDPPEDWQSLFSSTGAPTGIDFDADTGFNDGDFVRDFETKATRNGAASTCALPGPGNFFCTRDSSTFATGSKDTLEITPGWQCNRDNNVNSKIDIMNAFAAQFIDPVTGDQIMYFGLEKNKDNGNNNVAFWFLQNNVSCVSPGGNTPFTGVHADGDTLVVSAFTNGGGVSNINAYRWDANDNCIDNPILAGACDGKPIGSGGDCKANSGGDNICATTNSGPLEENDSITTTWLTSDATLGVGHTVVPTDFFEGGVNLTEVFGGVGEQAPSCFSTFLGNTRSSQELTATLFDFAAGALGGCETTLTTDAGDNGADGEEASPTSIGTGSVSSGTDTATLTIDGTDNWAGTLAWFLCGPVDNIASCDPDDGADITSRTVDQDSSGADFISGTGTLTSAGDYCWTAVFTPDEETAAAGVDPGQDDGTDECFTVAPVTPALSTQAGLSPVDLGDPVTDTAFLVGTASQPGSGGGGTNGVYETIDPTTPGDPAGGTITFTLVKSDDCTTLATSNDSNEENPQTLPVSGDGTYGPVSFTPDAPGDYSWIASYDGSPPNTNGTDHNTGCGDPDEDVTVQQVTTSISTTQKVLPQDQATISSDTSGVSLPADGTVTFTLFEATTGKTASENCLADDGTGELYSQSFQTVGGQESETFDTANDVYVSADGSYYWKVTYDPADSGFVGSQSKCSENVALTFTNDAGPGTVFPDPAP